MIASLKGILQKKAVDGVVVDVQGVGYAVSVSLKGFERLPSEGSPIFFYIYTAVREDDISLYGFVDESEKKVFQKLILVNGIGPKLALGILSGIRPQELVQAIYREDLARLTSISGIGKKTAERIVLDLKDKVHVLLGDVPVDGEEQKQSKKSGIEDEALSALVNLGYPLTLVEKALSQIEKGPGMTVETLIRQGLRSLSTVGAKI